MSRDGGPFCSWRERERERVHVTVNEPLPAIGILALAVSQFRYVRGGDVSLPAGKLINPLLGDDHDENLRHGWGLSEHKAAR